MPRGKDKAPSKRRKATPRKLEKKKQKREEKEREKQKKKQQRASDKKDKERDKKLEKKQKKELEKQRKKLEYLESYQLIRKRKRMDEVEYLFRHALIHQAVYHTIPVGQQKEMHLKVARSIEKVFQARLPDFYGTLAYHYSGAEELDRAEHYLIQAGERALRSSASSEALHYFKEALGI